MGLRIRTVAGTQRGIARRHDRAAVTAEPNPRPDVAGYITPFGWASNLTGEWGAFKTPRGGLAGCRLPDAGTPPSTVNYYNCTFYVCNGNPNPLDPGETLGHNGGTDAGWGRGTDAGEDRLPPENLTLDSETRSADQPDGGGRVAATGPPEARHTPLFRKICAR